MVKVRQGSFRTNFSPELIVLVDFKAIYPGVPPGIFASFPGVAHFLSFEEICQYPRVPGYPRVKSQIPGVNPREIKIPGVHLTFLKHLNITNFLNEQYLVFLCTVPSYSYFLILFSYTSHSSLIILYFLFFSSYSSHIILLFSFFSSNYYLLTF